MTELNQKWKIGNCQALMQELEPDSIDLIVTDPPYGYSFMGKDWDKAVPPVKCWQECLRILKPGAFAFIMSAPRQDVLAHNLVNLSDAGFETGFTSIYWTFASGFPKASNIGKMVDKRNGRHRLQYTELGTYLREMRGERPQKDIAKLFPSKTGGLTGCVANWELGLNVPTVLQWRILKQELNLDEQFDELIERKEADREVTAIDKRRSLDGVTYSPHSNKNSLYWERKDKPTTSQAKALDGSYSGFQPKPAVEIIMVVMKPLSEKTYVDQALANQKGITWMDDGRIPYQNEKDIGNPDRGKGYPMHDPEKGWNQNKIINNVTIGEKGRFPANLLVSDDILNDGKTWHGGKNNTQAMSIFGNDMEARNQVKRDCDSGSFSRYFDIDAWMDEQIKQLPKEARRTFPFLITPKASKSEKGADCTHPTVKPVKLISWLITIGSRKNDLVLDPFLGSGTTLEAGRFTDRRVLGFEISDEWEHLYPIRCMSHQPQLTLNYV